MNIRTIPFDLKEYVNELAGMPIEKQYEATRKDPACNTAMYEARLEDAETWLRENPESLMSVEVDDLVAIWKNHHGDKLDLGECFDRYMEGLIQEQAKDSVDIELNIE